MHRGRSAALIVLGVALMLLGLLFLAGAAGQVRRLAVAGVSLVLGAASAGYGVRGWRAAEASSPEAIRAEILALARREDGEVAHDEIVATLGSRAPAAAAVLDTLVLEGQCRRTPKSGTFYYVFSELQPRLSVLRCTYCDQEYDIASKTEKCPNCGGPVTTRVVSRGLAEGDVFRMDGES